ncbi:hypothetical protein K488DRAFT_67177 [Vararia minispora EC-137]|uniref:Uncharacterized protein n=1 Tax=Vararia minispora EC-137 TaxID=1314806 RepID=A0ACB8QZ29_9AGAM|nr:hypothetical protein K488DRAFT_67177 [Vararia minispora EC-137]
MFNRDKLLAECVPAHDYFTDLLTATLTLGLFLSYAPQHLRIILKGTSEGFSPWFLLLGSTSCAAGMLNMTVMQWGVLKCCDVYSAVDCLETVGGVIQVGLQWALFNVTQILYIIYFPPERKYVTITNIADSSIIPTTVKTSSWNTSIVLSWIVAIHVVFISFVSAILISTSPHDPSGTVRSSQLELWATFLGISSGLLAAFQYAPQIVHTYRLKLVGALSIPMMIMQTPGGIAMTLSIALRPGTNWTSWIQFLVGVVMQGTLLVMCIMWKFRQAKLGIDDFGHPLKPGHSDPTEALPVPEPEVDVSAGSITPVNDAFDERTPLLPASAKAGTQSRKRWWWF